MCVRACGDWILTVGGDAAVVGCVDDIVRARLRTLGVEEHRFMMESSQLPSFLPPPARVQRAD